MVIQKFLRGERVLPIDRDKKSSRVSRIQLARETCVATCRGSDALFPESNSGPRNAAGNPAVAVLVPVIGKGLLARISQSGDFFPTFCAFGPTPFRGPFLPGRGLKTNQNSNRVLIEIPSWGLQKMLRKTSIHFTEDKLGATDRNFSTTTSLRRGVSTPP